MTRGVGSRVHGVQRETVSVRFRPETMEALRAAAAAHPYRLTITQVIERGIELALAELGATVTPAPAPIDTRSRRISDHAMPVRLINTCLNHGIETVDDLARQTRFAMHQLPNVGASTIAEMERLMAAFGLSWALPNSNI